MAPAARGRHEVSRPRPARRALRRLLGLALPFLLLTPPSRADADSLRPWTGGTLPAFHLEALGGAGKHAPADHRGDIVLVHFWATYCEPCRAELPALQRLAERGAAQRLRVLTISVAEIDSRVERFRDATGLTLPVLMDRDRKATRAWKVDALPSTYVLDRAGRPRLYIEQEYDWDKVDSAALAARLDERPRKPTPSTQSMKPGG